jgi:sigma-B regulation protein RsbU (phosphoserine phosphatase)
MELFAAANNRIFHQLHQADVANNVSAAMVSLNMRTMEARYCKAGHEDVLRWSSSRQAVETLQAVGFFLGTFEEGQYDEFVFTVEKGDKIVLYTDGITEARNLAGDLFGVERLKALIQGHGNESADDIGNLITQEVSAFQSGREQADDIALVIVEIL